MKDARGSYDRNTRKRVEPRTVLAIRTRLLYYGRLLLIFTWQQAFWLIPVLGRIGLGRIPPPDPFLYASLRLHSAGVCGPTDFNARKQIGDGRRTESDLRFPRVGLADGTL